MAKERCVFCGRTIKENRIATKKGEIVCRERCRKMANEQDALNKRLGWLIDLDDEED